MIKNGKWVADTTETKYGEVETGLDTIGQEASSQKEKAVEVEKTVREEVGLATDQPVGSTEEPDVSVEAVNKEETEEAPEEPENLEKSTYDQTDTPTESSDQLTSEDQRD